VALLKVTSFFVPVALDAFIQSAQTVTALVTIFAQSVALG
jgi:hypothetical protein